LNGISESSDRFGPIFLVQDQEKLLDLLELTFVDQNFVEFLGVENIFGGKFLPLLRIESLVPRSGKCDELVLPKFLPVRLFGKQHDKAPYKEDQGHC
jgi:hypothetical protein